MRGRLQARLSDKGLAKERNKHKLTLRIGIVLRQLDGLSDGLLGLIGEFKVGTHVESVDRGESEEVKRVKVEVFRKRKGSRDKSCMEIQ